MPNNLLEKLSCSINFEGKEVVILRPSISMVFYSHANYATVKTAAKNVLQAYLRFVPESAIKARYQPDREYSTDSWWLPFDMTARDQLYSELSIVLPSEEDFYFGLCSTIDGQSGDYGVSFSGINFELIEKEDADVESAADKNSESVLRLEFPYNLVDLMPVESVIAFFEHIAEIFPFSSGHAGMSFIHTFSFMPESGEEIAKFAPRYLGFDLCHDFAALELRGKIISAHWLNLLSEKLVSVLGGEDKLHDALNGCEFRRVSNGLIIRAAMFPPIGDINRGAMDIGCLPDVAKTLRPIRLDKGLFTGLMSAESGFAWLERLDNLKTYEWDNSDTSIYGLKLE